MPPPIHNITCEPTGNPEKKLQGIDVLPLSFTNSELTENLVLPLANEALLTHNVGKYSANIKTPFESFGSVFHVNGNGELYVRTIGVLGGMLVIVIANGE